MNNKPHTKKQWQAPKIIDLDLKNTKSATDTFFNESTSQTFDQAPTSS